MNFRNFCDCSNRHSVIFTSMITSYVKKPDFSKTNLLLRSYFFMKSKTLNDKEKLRALIFMKHRILICEMCCEQNSSCSFIQVGLWYYFYRFYCQGKIITTSACTCLVLKVIVISISNHCNIKRKQNGFRVRDGLRSSCFDSQSWRRQKNETL